MNQEPRSVGWGQQDVHDVTPQPPVELPHCAFRPRRTSAYRKASVCNSPAPLPDKVLPCSPPANDNGSFSVELDATVSFFSVSPRPSAGTTQQQLRFDAVLSLGRIGDPIGGNLSVKAWCLALDITIEMQSYQWGGSFD
jgi:hypothetical protein